jgi:hypothetical protein
MSQSQHRIRARDVVSAAVGVGAVVVSIPVAFVVYIGGLMQADGLIVDPNKHGSTDNIGAKLFVVGTTGVSIAIPAAVGFGAFKVVRRVWKKRD